jgi:glycosyltransferase involved in cell wall biosynthesis
VKPRLLVVPHIYAENIAVREIELARRLTSEFEVFILKWSSPLHVEDASVFLRRVKQVRTALSAGLRSRSQFEANGTRVVEVPVWQPLLWQRLLGARAALEICKWLNRGTLRELLANLEITHLLLASGLFGVERRSGVRTFYDVVDWFPEESVAPEELARVRSELRAISEQVDAVFAVSEPLAEKLHRDCGVECTLLPNGADIAHMRGVAPARVSALREGLGIVDDFVIGYIGNHGAFTGVDLVVNAFLAARNQIPKSKLLIVGPAEYWSELLRANRDAGVIATGNVLPSEIAEYFNAIDIGVVGKGKNAGTDFAFHIKMVEYSACRKCVVSTPLETWRRLAWPNIIFAEPNAQAFADAFVKAHSMRWRSEWDGIIENYDWQALASKAAKVMIGTGERERRS